MTKNWWIKLEVGAWVKDTQKLNMECLGALLQLTFELHDSPNKGCFRFAFDLLSNLFRTSEEKAKNIVQKLSDSGVLDVDFHDDNTVTIRSRRITREAEIQRIRSEAGKKGGRPKSKRKAKEKQTSYSYSNSKNDSYSKKKDRGVGKGKGFENEITEIITYLNELADRDFNPETESHRKHIRSRLKEGFTPEVLKAIVVYKVRQWKGDAKGETWLRPQTLFNSDKCAIYRDEVATAIRTGKAPANAGTSSIEERNQRIAAGAEAALEERFAETQKLN